MDAQIEERVARLEDTLSQFIKQTTQALLRMERDTAALKQEMRSFKDEMREFKEEMLAFKDEMRDFKNESRRQLKESNLRWGELANKMGTLVEDLVFPSLRRIIREQFDLEAELIMMPEKRLPDGRTREFDAVALAGPYVILNSTKTTLRNVYVDSFINEIKDFREFFPEYNDRKLIGILAALHIPEQQLDYAEKKGFLVIGVGEQIMEIKNTKGFKPKEWD